MSEAVDSQKIIELRLNARLSQNKLGKRAGVSQGTVANIEKTGRGDITSIGKIADALGVPIKELLLGKIAPLHEPPDMKGGKIEFAIP